MEFQYLGSGMQISRIVLGCMGYGKKSWIGQNWVIEDEDEVMKLMKYAYDNGIRAFDTADGYSRGESERLIGKFLKKFNIPRSTIVIMTKVWAPANIEGLEDTPENLVNRKGLSRKHIMDGIDGSTERLGTYVDLYQIHRLDRKVPMEEIMRALNDVVTSGKARYIGASSMRATEFVELQHIAEKNGWVKFISMQNFYNLAYREEEREMIPYCKKHNIGLLPWSPIGRGVLARPNNTENTTRGETDFGFKTTTFRTHVSTLAIVDRVEEIAKKKGISMAQVAIAWTLAKDTSPIVGLSSIKRIDEAIAALKVQLTPDEIHYLEEPYVPQEPQALNLNQ